MPAQFISFPENFIWGAATSSFQIEGHPLADGAVSSDWYRWTKTPGHIAGGQDADIACDHYHRYKEDVALMKELGLMSYRLSISWPRIIPERGRVNEKGLDFYRRLLDELKKAGIEPNVTLFHWEVPDWVQGGWENRETAYAFREYAEAVFKRFGGEVPYWSTLNEPVCTAELGYLMRVFPPGKPNNKAYAHVAHHLNLAHGLAAQAFRQLNLPGKIGWAHAINPMYPVNSEKKNIDQAKWMQDLKVGVYLNPAAGKGYPDAFFNFLGKPEGPWEQDLKIIAEPVDFLGVNHYFPDFVRYSPGFDPFDNNRTPPPGTPLSDMDWTVRPEAFYELLKQLWKDYDPKKILVTENGFATRDSLRSPREILEDDVRVHYLGTYLAQARRAIQDGVPLAGYYAWSLLDNFEWTNGYDPRFGLIHVDFQTQKRTLKKSAKWYKEVIARNGFDPALLPRSPSYRVK